MSDERVPLIFALALDQNGSAEQISPALDAPIPRDRPVWLHMDRTHPEAQTWLRDHSGIPEIVCDALLAENTRPRTWYHASGVLINLRGINLNPGAQRDDLIVLRAWLDRDRLVTLRAFRFQAVAETREHLSNGKGPTSLDAVVAEIADALTDRIGERVEEVDDKIDELAERVGKDDDDNLVRPLADARHDTISLRRYLAPQRDVLRQLASLERPPLEPSACASLTETADHVTRLVEQLDAAVERAALVRDELTARFDQRLGRQTYLFSVIAAVFLPLGLVTGLLGVNVAGIPGTENPWGFAIVCVILVALTIGTLVWLRAKRML